MSFDLTADFVEGFTPENSENVALDGAASGAPQVSAVAVENLSQPSIEVRHIAESERGYSLRQTEGQRLEFAKKLLAEKNFNLHTFDISAMKLGPMSRFTLAIDFIRKNDICAVGYIHLFQLTEPQRLEIAKNFLPTHPHDVVYYVQDVLPHFDLTPEGQREILSLAMRRNFLVAKMCPDISLCYNAFIDREGRSPQEIEALHLQWRLQTPKEISDALIQAVEVAEEAYQDPEDCSLQIMLGAVDYWRTALTSEQFAWVSKEGFFEKIFGLEAPFLRLSLIYSVVTAAKATIDPTVSDPMACLDSVARGELLKLPLSQLLIEDSVSRLPLIFAIQECARDLKETKRFLMLWMTLHLLAENTHLSVEQKTLVIESLCHDPKLLLKEAQYLCLVLQFDRSDLLQQRKKPIFSELAKRAFESVVLFSKPRDMDHFLAVFSAYRQPDAMMRYAANLKTLNDPEVMESLAGHISSVLDGTYISDRYNIMKNRHLRKIDEGFPEVFQAWKHNDDRISLEELIPQTETSFEMREWFQSMILGKDFTETIGFPCPELQEFLLGNDTVLDQLKDSLQVEKNKVAQQHLALQNKFCQLAKSTKPEIAKRLLQELLKNDLIPLSSPLRSAMLKKMEEIQSHLSLQEFFACETDSAEDILLCGTEVARSCQVVSGDPHLNQGLLGYLHHGQTRLIAIKDREGRIVARSLIRLLWDGEKPVLFLEKLYTADKNIPHFESAILAMAKRCADRLGCLLTSIDAEGPPYLKNLHSLDGIAPNEYVDGCNGLWARGQFEIGQARLLYNPLLEDVPPIPIHVREQKEENWDEIDKPTESFGTGATENFDVYSGWGDEANPYECGDD